MLKHTPATPLPWKSSHPMHLDLTAHRHGLVRVDSKGPAVATMVEYGKLGDVPVRDAAYIAHAANAYPKLVADAREMRIAFGDVRDWPEDWSLSWHDRLVAREVNPTIDNIRREVFERHVALLRELGEAS